MKRLMLLLAVSFATVGVIPSIPENAVMAKEKVKDKSNKKLLKKVKAKKGATVNINVNTPK